MIIYSTIKAFFLEVSETVFHSIFMK